MSTLEEQTTPQPWLKTYWQLVVFVVIYLIVVGLVMTNSLVLGLVPVTDDIYGDSSITAPVVSSYEIQNRGGEVIGEMICTLTPNGIYTDLDCTHIVQRYEVRVRDKLYMGVEHDATLQIRWLSSGMEMIQFDYEQHNPNGSTFHAYTDDGKLVTVFWDEPHSVDIPEHALLELEWFWHSSVLKADTGQALKIPYLSLRAWDSEQRQLVPAVEEMVLRVRADETLTLQNGEIVDARKITMGDMTVWIAYEDIAAGVTRPIKIDFRSETYILVP